MAPIENATLFSEIRSWLEVLYFASGLVVMVLIGLGLRQLKLAKDQISLAKNQIETSKDIFKTQSKRAAVEAAVVECRRFAETIVQDSIALDKYCTLHGISYFDDVTLTKTENGFQINAKNVKKEDIDKMVGSEEILNRYMNGLEAYALFFLSGVADENIAFHSNAKTFIKFAEKAFKLIPCCEIEDDDMEPIKALYFMWSSKYEAKQLKIKKKEIEKKLSEHKETTIKSIGT
ncbi:hypothetical protein [Aeromonas dhakensis]|uniref:hypothetical protein n=1 Tax=Aeromonas dhakensis TaxID=196024 RepID=UPI00300E5188